MEKYLLVYPGNRYGSDELPDPETIDPLYWNAEWVADGVDLYGREIYRLQFKPVKVTFNNGVEQKTFMSNELPQLDELPPIIEKDGMEGDWVIPDEFYKDTVITPKYREKIFTATFIDCSGKRMVSFRKGSKIVEPVVTKKIGYRCSWEKYEASDSNIEVHAVYEPVKITFRYNDVEDTQDLANCRPPVFKKIKGYDLTWNYSRSSEKDIVVEPTMTPQTFKIKFTDGDNIFTSIYTFGTEMKMPPVPKREGMVGKWNFDPNMACDQIVHPIYEPMKMRVHLPDGTVKQYGCGEMMELPKIEGMEWPYYTERDQCLDLYPRRKIDFALFYVDDRLVYCVPFRDTDRHYVDEMLEKRTVPKFRRTYGKWKLFRTLFGYEYYVGDYSVPQPDLPLEETSYEWDLDKVPMNIVRGKTTITLDGEEIDLLSTYFSKITGLDRLNASSLCPRKFLDWLDHYGIEYENHVRGSEVRKMRGDLYLGFYKNGTILIGYEDRILDAIEFLQDQDIYFEKTKYERYVNGKRAYGLRGEVLLDDETDESIHKAELELYPVDRYIPSMTKRKPTPYTTLTGQKKNFNVTHDELEEMMRGNRFIIDKFNVEFNPDYEFTIISEEQRTVELKKYNGEETMIDFPEKVFLDKNEREKYTVVSIGAGAFQDNSELVSIELPHSIERICNSAFKGCEYLNKVSLENGLRTIGTFAFDGCLALKSIRIPQSVTSIGKGAFSDLYRIILDCDQSCMEGSAVNDKCIIECRVKVETRAPVSSKEKSPIHEFVESLTNDERRFIKMVLNGEDPTPFLRDVGLSRSIMQKRINEKAMDILDDDYGLFDKDDNDNIVEDYREELKEILGD